MGLNVIDQHFQLSQFNFNDTWISKDGFQLVQSAIGALDPDQ